MAPHRSASIHNDNKKDRDEDDEHQMCLICEKPMTLLTERCVTDCCHEFCLQCVCLQLADRKNKCPACFASVKKVFQMFSEAESSSAGTRGDNSPKPAQVKFCNATYVLDVSIWSVEDPAKRLASLFDLEHARLIHQGKLLKKGDVWPGTVVQLFGTRRSSSHGSTSNSLTCSVSSCLRPLKHQLEPSRLNWLVQFVCCPCSLVFRFFHSMFCGKEYNTLPRRGYQPIDPADQVAAGRSNAFHEPGRVESPHYTDSI